MSLELDENQAQYQIRSYIPGLIKVNDRKLTSSIIITANHLVEHWPPQTVSELTTENLLLVLEFKPDVLLLGTGAIMHFLPESLYGTLINHGIGVELMDSHAACRTFNALTAEDRNVAAAILIK